MLLSSNQIIPQKRTSLIGHYLVFEVNENNNKKRKRQACLHVVGELFPEAIGSLNFSWLLGKTSLDENSNWHMKQLENKSIDEVLTQKDRL